MMFIRVSILMILICSTALGAELRHGVDVSFLPQVEVVGGEFRVAAKPVDLFVLLRAKGIDTVRLRLWHSPTDDINGLSSTLALATRAHDAGFDILLDIHYSDTWADPGHQSKPQAWADVPFPALVDSVHAYTRDVLMALAAQGTPPDLIQLGNEISAGMLWNGGRVGGVWSTPAQWSNLAALLNAGISAVNEVFPTSRPEILVHYDQGGNNNACRWFYDALIEQGVEFDAIALSYYPWWHGTMDELGANLDNLAQHYGKPLYLVETAYPWTLAWNDSTHNPVGLPEHVLATYPPTPGGQRRYLTHLLSLVEGTHGDLGAGVFWWAPEWIAVPGLGSSWENCALFDFEGDALPAWNAWRNKDDVPPGGTIKPHQTRH